MRIAVVGAGIAGLTAARELDAAHEVHLFDAGSTAGGHAYTVEVEEDGRRFPIDMGFIVYNDRNYPIFSRLLYELGVSTAASSMGFSVADSSSGIEYSGEGLRSLLASPGNLLRPDFWRLVRDYVRFCRIGTEALETGVSGDVESFCRERGLSSAFERLFLKPMAGAIWSTPRDRVGAFPAESLLRFFERHGLLSLNDRPAWRTVRGGAGRYVDALLQAFGGETHFGSPVELVRRDEAGVRLSVDGVEARFDQVVMALHSDQALRLLDHPTASEVEVLGAIHYRDNDVVLHNDRSLLPSHRAAWTSWNVSVDPRGDEQGDEAIAITYLMNKLQPLPTSTPWCVTLNRTPDIEPSRIRHQVTFAHPQFDQRAIEAQQRWREISGRHHTHYCGAYWRYGFHEDGAWSGQRVARSLALARWQVA